jgi:LmbE family N-acetylglucosaminyl deacetylase
MNPTTPSKVAMAIAAHPDDIEFSMAGTLLLLKQAEWEIHCLNISSGNLGNASMSTVQTATVRRREAKDAARILGAHWHPPFARDLEIFYDDKSLRHLAALIREVRPSIILTHSPRDYMEDHMNTCRLAVTAAFARGMPNYKTIPARPAVEGDFTLYHPTPHFRQTLATEPAWGCRFYRKREDS